VRRTIALLTAALLSGCGLTDGPNRTGTAWLDSQDLGTQGLESVTIPVSALRVDTIQEPGVPSLNGVGFLSVGETESYRASTSIWFDPRNVDRWIHNATSLDTTTNWRLELKLDAACPKGDLRVSITSTTSGVGDTLKFLQALGPADSTLSGVSCRAEDSVIAVTLPFRTLPTSAANFGIHIESNGFDAREIYYHGDYPHQIARVTNATGAKGGKGDTLFTGNFDGRPAWQTRWTPSTVGSIASTAGAGKRLRIRFDTASIRNNLLAALHLPASKGDSFENQVAIFSARAVSRYSKITDGAMRRFRLASWVVQSVDTTMATVSAAPTVVGFSSARVADGKSMSGELHVAQLPFGAVSICVISGSDSLSFYTREGVLENHFILYPGQDIEAPVYADPGWMKMRFRYDKNGSAEKILYIRTILSAGVAADDQIQSVDGSSNAIFRSEAIATPDQSTVRFEARTAFNRIINVRAQPVWTDLYPVALSGETAIDNQFQINLWPNPVDSVTFLVRRRTLGVVQ